MVKVVSEAAGRAGGRKREAVGRVEQAWGYPSVFKILMAITVI